MPGEIAKKGCAGMRCRILLVAAIALMLTAVGAFGLRLIEAYPVEKVHIESGFQRVSKAEISSMIEPLVQSSLITLNTASVKAVLEAEVWIDWVRVERVWPSTVRIEVHEHDPIALFNNSLVSRRGVRFAPDVLPENVGALLRLKGAENDLSVLLDMYRKVARILDPITADAFSITGLMLDDYQGWLLELNGRLSIRVDRENPLGKLKRFVDYSQRLGNQPLQAMTSIDLRYPHGLAVQ